MADQRARWIAGGNIATGFLVFGNVVTGFIAIGNVARGFIAIGNLAVGVIAIGNVGIGVVSGFGATVALGLLAGSGVVALPVLEGTAGVVNATRDAPILALVPLLGWLFVSFVLPGRRPPLPGPSLTPLDRIAQGEAAEGWIAARARRAGDGAVRLERRGGALEISASPEALAALDALKGQRVLALIRAEERLAPHEGGYREAGPRVRSLGCAAIVPAPRRDPPWANADHLQWWLARAFRVGAVVGALALGIKLAFAWAAG